MNTQHRFLFNPEEWIGDGTITFNEFGHGLKFYTQWKVLDSSQTSVSCSQEIEVEGLMDKTQNSFTLSEIKAGTFSITLENESLGKVVGKGVMDEKTVAWEFSNKELGFEGFEIYELQEDGNYITRGEYVSIDQLRTIIEGKIWKKQVKVADNADEIKGIEEPVERKDETENKEEGEKPLDP